MRLFWFLLVLPLAGFTQPNSRLSQEKINQLCAVDGSVEAGPDLREFVARLDEKYQDKHSLRFSQMLFTKTRQSFLRRYLHEATFRQTLARGYYNCLTGTTLYAILLDHFEIPYKIVETNYHIFLMVSTNEGEVLFEATDPLHGFVDNATDIQKRIERYKRNTPLQIADPAKKYYSYNVNLYREVTIAELRGLLHYNLSTKAYNEKDFQSAINHLEQTINYYISPRLHEFSTVLLLSVMESDMETASKQECIARIQAVRKKQMPAMASLKQ